MENTVSRNVADLFSRTPRMRSHAPASLRTTGTPKQIAFSYLFFSDVRKSVSDKEKYCFARELVEFADQNGFEAVYFPERHFHEFGSIYANNGIMAAYFAPLTKHIRLRTAAVTNTLHHPVEIVENWAMVDILSDGRVDLGFGNGWNKPDFILSPDTYENRFQLRDERIPVIQKLWRGETVQFTGPGGEEFPITVYPRPIQKELNVWYVTTSDRGFAHAGAQGYNVFTMLYGFDLESLGKKIALYREARKRAYPSGGDGCVSIMMHTFVHPDLEWVQRVVELPFKEYIRSSLIPHMAAADRKMTDAEIGKMVDYSYARYFRTGGIFGSVEDCQRQVDKAIEVGVNEIAFLQDFGVDYAAAKDSLVYLKQLVGNNQDGQLRHG